LNRKTVVGGVTWGGEGRELDCRQKKQVEAGRRTQPHVNVGKKERKFKKANYGL